MIDRYLKLLDNFKEEDIATFLKNLREKIIFTLQGPYFSSKTTCFFTHPNEDGEPFTNFDSEPRQIVQLKQVINALYHAQLAFEDLQSVNLRNGDKKFQDLKKLYYKTIEHGYKASYLLTHLDIDFHELFRSEIQQIWQFLAPIKAFADSHKESAIEFSSVLKNYPTGYKAGVISGTAIAQMKPNDGNYDYDFLANFGAVLPGYIQQLTTYIQHYGPQISTYQPTIDKAKLDELQEQAFRLLNSIENLQSDDIFISFKTLNYIKIIREIINLSMSSLEQIGYANDSSQAVIRHNMKRLKYELLPELFSIVDRLEDEGLLNPGTLSQPMMAQIKPFYELMAFYAAKFADFSAEGEELLTIEDAQFIDKRLEKTRQRISVANWNLTTQIAAQTALNNFFAIIENPQYAAYSLLNLPQTEKDTLKKEFNFLLPYIKVIDSELSNVIIRDLTSANSYTRNLLRPWHWLTGTAGPVAVTSLIPLKVKLQTALAKERATQELHIELNKDIINYVENYSEMDIYPYQSRPELTCFDEAKILEINPTAPEHQHLQFSKDSENVWITHHEALTFTQAKTLAHYYERKCLQLDEARTALHSFLSFLVAEKHPKINIDAIKLQLRRWYSLFQPYLVENLFSSEKAKKQDAVMVEFLSGKPLLGQQISKLDRAVDYSTDNFTHSVSTLFERLFTEEDIIFVLAQFESLIALTQERAKVYSNRAQQKYIADVQSRELHPDINTDKRANFVLKHTLYSQTVAAYRSSLFELTKAFNTSLRVKLQPAEKGMPFPEMEDQELARLEIHQAVAVKRFFNSLYHLEQICIQLESLDQKSSQSLYVYHLIQAKSHIDELVSHAKALVNDPHLSLFATELKDKALALYKVFTVQQKNYAVSSEEVELTNPKFQGKAVKYSGLWYALRSFMLIPEHIKAATQHEELTAEMIARVDQRTKQAALNIEAIIESSDSYFRLFLQTPTMYRLYKELKAKLEQFTHLSHTAAMDHLEELSHDLFVRILITTDEWEDKLGLKPGLLADPMKAVLDEFHKGLLENLNLNSQEHLALLSSLAPINYRMEAAKRRKQAAAALLKGDDALNTNIENLEINKERLLKLSLSSKIRLLQLFLKEVNEYHNYHRILPASPLIQHINKIRLTKLYKILQPLLLSEQKRLGLKAQPIATQHYTIEILLQEIPLPAIQEEVRQKEEQEIEVSESEEKEEFQLDEEGYLIEFKSDKFIAREDGTLEMELDRFSPIEIGSPNEEISTAKQKPDELKNIVYIANAVLNHYQGYKNSLEFEIATADEKLAYLEECVAIQEKESEKLRFEYTEKAFACELERLTSRYIGLYHTRAEYNSALQSFLQAHATAIIEQSQYTQDINAKVKKLLDAKAEEFDQTNKTKFTQLEAVMNALAQFDSYFGKATETVHQSDGVETRIKKNLFFETESTLRAKIRLIDNLTTIVHSKDTVEKRLADIKAEIKKPSFVATMLKHRHYNTFSFAWIAQCFISLLSALHLYTPKYKVLFQRLEEAAAKATTAESLTAIPVHAATNRFGIFAPIDSNPVVTDASVSAPSNELSANPITVP
ncbi:hypothetical protein [Legionella clemsonensis]|uniref:SdhA, substrate of the Dot/Icm system n=1 Tax=Legionella clemsonensis TaxID=1867846 RepID=A0A222NZ85_9GAMM|nr:hypothetical protein [Legionella clemsonensis]ASQ44910.1 hypothetical protein clem_01730 [Legionella clemsonensis]